MSSPARSSTTPPIRLTASKAGCRCGSGRSRVWSDGTALRAIALVADQRPVLKIMPEAAGPEAFADSEELARVTEFLSTVREIENADRPRLRRGRSKGRHPQRRVRRPRPPSTLIQILFARCPQSPRAREGTPRPQKQSGDI